MPVYYIGRCTTTCENVPLYVRQTILPMNATVTTDPIKPFSRHESDVTCTRLANQSTDARPGQCVFFSTVQYLVDDPNTYTVAWSGNQSNNVRSGVLYYNTWERDPSIRSTPGCATQKSFSRCNIVFAEIDAHAFQVCICESSSSLSCRRLFALPLTHWRLYYRSLRRRLL